MTTQIFNGQGFLTADGKAFLNDGFTKEVKKIFATASTLGDVLTISCILKSIIGEHASDKSLSFITPPPPKPASKPVKPELHLIKSEVKNNVIPFPGHKAMVEMNALLRGLSDVPMMDQE